jgi:hypothetical protein
LAAFSTSILMRRAHLAKRTLPPRMGRSAEHFHAKMGTVRALSLPKRAGLPPKSEDKGALLAIRVSFLKEKEMSRRELNLEPSRLDEGVFAAVSLRVRRVEFHRWVSLA